MSAENGSGSDRGTWDDYRLMVVADLKTIKDSQADTAKELAQMRIEVEKLKVYAAMWGAAAAVIVSAIVTLLIQYFTSGAPKP